MGGWKGSGMRASPQYFGAQLATAAYVMCLSWDLSLKDRMVWLGFINIIMLIIHNITKHNKLSSLYLFTFLLGIPFSSF